MGIDNELRSLYKEYQEALDAFNYADAKFIDSVIAKLTYIETKIAALKELYKEEENV